MEHDFAENPLCARAVFDMDLSCLATDAASLCDLFHLEQCELAVNRGLPNIMHSVVHCSNPIHLR